MSNNKVQPQLQKLWNVVSSQRTRDAYVETAAVTVEIAKETAVLLWYVVLLVLVGSDALITFGRKTVHNVRLMVGGLDNSKSMQDIASDTGQALVTASQNTLATAIAQARNQLGLPEKIEPELPPLPAKQPEPELVPKESAAPDNQAEPMKEESIPEEPIPEEPTPEEPPVVAAATPAVTAAPTVTEEEVVTSATEETEAGQAKQDAPEEAQ
ncbi:MAG: hypothetical protein AB4040_05205 [Synechococcus sp.]